MKLIIFGGTSEGRELAEWAARNNFSAVLCVATGYGSSVCGSNDLISIREGRLDMEEMYSLFECERPDIAIDATHPHAALVSENICLAAKRADLPLLRIVRPKAYIPDGERYRHWSKESLICVSSAAEALSYLKQDKDPILLTTGSKELSDLSLLPGFEERVYARVLPDEGVISDCKKAGLKGDHIIAMQGPFMADLNLALIRHTGAKWIVTKESGVRGGFPEKVKAAADADIRMIVIDRPADEEGFSIWEAEKEILKMSGVKDACKAARLPDITLIGMGMGTSQLTTEAQRALKKAQIIFGSARMIEDVSGLVTGKELISMYKPDEIFSFLSDHPEVENACVLYSGDTGFYSGASAFPAGSDIRILPGISSFSCLCARFRLREEEFYPASAHGKDTDITTLLAEHEKIFLLLDPKTTLSSACRELCGAGYGKALVYAGVRLGYEDERLFKGKAEDLTENVNDALAVMAVERKSSDNA